MSFEAANGTIFLDEINLSYENSVTCFTGKKIKPVGS
jgi:hypothetical protein